MSCDWCDKEAVATLIVKGSKKTTRAGRESFTREVTAPVCRHHKDSFESRGMSTRELEKKF